MQKITNIRAYFPALHATFCLDSSGGYLGKFYFHVNYNHHDLNKFSALLRTFDFSFFPSGRFEHFLMVERRFRLLILPNVPIRSWNNKNVIKMELTAVKKIIQRFLWGEKEKMKNLNFPVNFPNFLANKNSQLISLRQCYGMNKE